MEAANLDLILITVVLLLGLGVSFFSGLLGIGGGIIMTPLLLYVPSLLGLGHLGMREVAGLTMVQGFVGALSGLVKHRDYGFVNRDLVLNMGVAIGLSSLFGAVLSKYVGQDTLLAIFALLALIAAGLMLVSREEGEDGATGIEFNRPLAISISIAVGFLGGLVGQGGAFILIPLMLFVLKLPTRITIGSSLGIVLFSAAAGFVGKLGTGQIILPLALALVVGAVPGAQLGSYVSKRVSTRALRGVLAALIGLTAVNMWWGLLVH